MKWVLQHTQNFPKHERFRLAKRIDDAYFEFHAALIAATKTTSQKKYLTIADLELHKVRVYFRIAMEMKYTTHNQYGYAAQQLTELGNLLGGWMKEA